MELPQSFACPVLRLALLCCATISVNHIAASKRYSCPGRVWGRDSDVELVGSVVRQRFDQDCSSVTAPKVWGGPAQRDPAHPERGGS